MPLIVSDTLQALLNEPSQQTWGFAMSQLPSPNLNSPAWQNSVMASQVMLDDPLTYRISRSQDMASDTLELTFADDNAARMSTNPGGAMSKVFKPGPLDNKILFFLGLRGQIYSGKPNWSETARDSVLQFTGYVQTDASNQIVGRVDKTVTIPDLSSQFRMQVYDTLPHPLFGNQGLAYYDKEYDLHIPLTGFHAGSLYNGYVPDPLEAGLATNGTVWVCDGKMFTTSSEVPVWGATHIAPALYVNISPTYDANGNCTNPQETPISSTGWTITGSTGSCANWSLDYANGIVTLSSSYLTSVGHSGGLPGGAKLSIAGNPTYMQPEVMIRKLLVEKANWAVNFTNLQWSRILLPMFDGQDRSVWDCIRSIAAQTCPRFLPWNIWVDENGVVYFYEYNLDQPPVRSYIEGRNFFNANQEYTSRQLRTVVRGDATVAEPDLASSATGASSDQAITALAFDIRACNEYGITEPLLLTSDVTDAVRHLTPTQAISHLNMVAQSVLYQVSRPTLTITGKIVPDYTLQIGDKVYLFDDKVGMDREFTVQAMEKSGDGKQNDMQVTLEEYYETVNLALGAPAGVSSAYFGMTVANSGSTVISTPTVQPTGIAPPSGQIISDVRIGSHNPVFVYQSGDYARNQNGDPIVATWNADLTAPMHFDIFVAPSNKALGIVPPSQQLYNYNNLPPSPDNTSGLAQPWVAETAPGTNATVYYVAHNTGTLPNSTAADGYTYYVGPDSIFYRYKNGTNPTNGGNSDYHISEADLTYTWTPPGNTPTPATGTPVTGTAYTVYLWKWFYMCLDSTLVNPATSQPYYLDGTRAKEGRLLMRINPAQDASPITVSATGGHWVNDTWSNPPGPEFTTGVTKCYANLVVGASDYTTPPPGFVGANVMGDGVNVGVSYGGDVSSGNTYVNYLKRTKAHFCVFAMASTGQSQFLRFPVWVHM